MRYRLPEALGGGEYDSVTDIRSKDGQGTPFDLPGLAHVVWLPTWILTEVTAEPSPGYYLIDYPAGPFSFVAEHEEGYGWHLVGHPGGVTWDEVQKLYPGSTFTRLVPDPFAEPVTLPWGCLAQKFSSIGPSKVSVEVWDPYPPAQIRLVRITARPFGDGEWRLSAPHARDMARALMTAADAAEKESS